jgi:hypothetical protein
VRSLFASKENVSISHDPQKELNTIKILRLKVIITFNYPTYGSNNQHNCPLFNSHLDHDCKI